MPDRGVAADTPKGMGANGRVPVEPSATFTACGTPDPPPPPASQAKRALAPHDSFPVRRRWEV